MELDLARTRTQFTPVASRRRRRSNSRWWPRKQSHFMTRCTILPSHPTTQPPIPTTQSSISITQPSIPQPSNHRDPHLNLEHKRRCPSQTLISTNPNPHPPPCQSPQIHTLNADLREMDRDRERREQNKEWGERKRRCEGCA